MYNFKYVLAISFIVFLIFEGNGQSQNSDSSGVSQAVPGDTIPDPEMVLPDTIPDTEIAPADSVQMQPEGDIQSTIKYSARDSIVTQVGTQNVYLYGQVKVTYGQIDLEAAKIMVNWADNTLTAEGVTDSTGKVVGKPVFKDGPQTYVTEKIKYNLDTEKAIITGVVTEQNQGFIHGKKVRKNDEDELFISDAMYTTCNLEHPHFHISAKKIKMIPDDKIVTGPFNLVISDIPTPLGFPLGLFPSPRKRASGIIIPTYGEENQRGFFLRDGGYFFAINDYVNLTLLGEIYSKGGKGFKIASDYRKRYAHNGSLNFHYNQRVTGLPGEQDKSEDFRLQWSHTPQSRGNSRFSASVNAATSTYNNNNSLTFEENLNATLNSSVSYSKVFQNTPFNLSMSARHNQNLRTGIVNLTLPEFSLNMSRIYPFNFKNVMSSGNSVFSKINFNYSLQGRNIVTNQPKRGGGFDVTNDAVGSDTVEFNFNNLGELFKRGELGFRHSIPLSTSFKALRYFTISPSVNFDQLIYLKKLNYQYDEEQKGVRVDTINGVSAPYTYSFGAGTSTNIYGTYFFKGGRIQAMRHMITPSIGFSYSPDFSDPRYDYFQEVQIDSTGRTRALSRFDGFAYGSPGGGESKSLSFGVRNTLEMKVRQKQKNEDDTVEFKKVKLLENFSLNSSYNFAADSFKLAPVSMSARTQLFNNKLSVSASARLDPYIYRVVARNEITGEVTSQRRVNEYAWNNGRGLGQISNASIRLNTSLNPKAREKEQARKDAVEGSPNATPEQIEYIQANADEYVDWDVPWNLRLGYTWNYNKTGYMDSRVTQSLSFSGDVSITEKWKIDFTSGYDFDRKKVVDPRINIYRDLHCWEMRLSWVPTGRFQSYSLNINVKATILQDLKLSRRRSFLDR